MRSAIRPAYRAAVAALAALSVMAATAAAASRFYIRGGGYGHGIGMSQYGAYGYALHGKDYRFILRHYYQGTAIGTTDPNRTVRVLLKTGAASFSGANRAGSKHLNPGETYAVTTQGSSLRLIAANGKTVETVSAPLTVSGPSPLTVPGAGAYRGDLEFRPDGASVDTFNDVGLDDYVRGVVASEMPSSWAAQALEAQAVAARTYAITAGGPYLYPDTRSQVYGGVRAETAATDAAVAATRGQIVTYRGKPAVTYFFSSSGGYTESVQNVFLGSSPEPWLKGVPDPYDGAGGNPYHRWLVQMTLGAAAHDLGALVKGSLIGIRVTQHGASPRVVKARVVATHGSTSATGPQLEQLFGLRSTYAAFTTITTNVRFSTPTVGAQLARAPVLARALAEAAAVMSGATPTLTGSIYPARAGTAIAIQRRTGRRWRTIAHVKLDRRGRYTASLPGPGIYRVVYESLDGPAVAVP